MAVKIASVAKPNQVLVGEFIYNILLSSSSHKDFLNNSKFIEVTLDPLKWNYHSHFNPGSIYRVYEYLENNQLA
jgi:adenylate cyclase